MRYLLRMVVCLPTFWHVTTWTLGPPCGKDLVDDDDDDDDDDDVDDDDYDDDDVVIYCSRSMIL